MRWPGLWRDITLNGIVASPLVPINLRWRLLKAFGMNVERSTISPRVWFGSPRLSIGRGSYINTGCLFSTHEPITIGQNCYFGMRVLITASSHELGPSERRAGPLSTAPVVVGDGAWSGANVTILPGVTIGAGTVIGAGAVVTKDCKPNSLYLGVPATWIRDLDDA
jgi:maltose O-acetyltransferase